MNRVNTSMANGKKTTTTVHGSSQKKKNMSKQRKRMRKKKSQTTKAVKFEWFIAHARSMKRKSYDQFTIENRVEAKKINDNGEANRTQCERLKKEELAMQLCCELK